MIRSFLINRRFTLWIVLILSVIIIRSAFIIFSEEEQQELIKVSVIVEDNNNNRWTSFYQGLDEAAKDFDVDLTLIATGTFADMQEEMALVDQRIEDGSEGIILSPCDSDSTKSFQDKLSSNLNMILVETDVTRNENLSQNISVVSPDYVEMGNTIISQIIEDYGNDLLNKRVKIIASNFDQLGTSEAVQVIKDGILLHGGKVSSLEEVSTSSTSKYINKITSDIVIAVDDKSLYHAAKEKFNEGKTEVSLYGIGCSEQNVYYLEQNTIQSMIVTNDFKMGYMSLEILADNIRKHSNDAQNVKISFKAIRPDAIHDPENEKLLFPVVK